MDILIGKRQEGKSTHLIQMSAAGHGTIVAPTEQSAEYIKNQAKSMKLDIPEPIGWGTFVRSNIGRKGPYLLDELGGILRGLGVKTAILDEECVIANLSSDVVHSPLTSRCRKSAGLTSFTTWPTVLCSTTSMSPKRLSPSPKDVGLPATSKTSPLRLRPCLRHTPS